MDEDNDTAQDFLIGEAMKLMARGSHPDEADSDVQLLGTHLHTFINYELHLRKTFWVDASLGFQLSQTHLDIEGEVLKLPFPCCAFVFADPNALSLAEALLAKDETVSNRHPVRVVTVYLQQPPDTGGPSPAAGHAVLDFDRLDGSWPYLLGRDLWVEPKSRLDSILDSHFPEIDVAAIDDVFRCAELKALLHLVINAVLYATSAGVEPAVVPSPIAGASARPASHRRKRAQDREALKLKNQTTGEDVFFLPGKIDIRQVEQLEALRSAGGGSEGRQLLARFMVRATGGGRTRAGWTSGRGGSSPTGRGPTSRR